MKTQKDAAPKEVLGQFVTCDDGAVYRVTMRIKGELWGRRDGDDKNEVEPIRGNWRIK